MATQRRSSNAVLPGSWNASTSTVSSASSSSSSPSPHTSPAPPPRTPSPSLAALRPTPSFLDKPSSLLDKPPSYSPTITPTFVHPADPRACLHRLEQQLDEAARSTQRLARALAAGDKRVRDADEAEASEGGRVRDLEQRVQELEARLAGAVSRDQREAELLEALRQVPAGPFLFRMTR
ncbi:hypothetical protein EV121DRAFT_294223 [Schizophyllum commune]